LTEYDNLIVNEIKAKETLIDEMLVKIYKKKNIITASSRNGKNARCNEQPVNVVDAAIFKLLLKRSRLNESKFRAITYKPLEDLNGIKNAYDQYKENSVYTASPEELTLMLYNGLVKFLMQAQMALNDKNIEKANKSIIRLRILFQNFGVHWI